MKIAVLRKMILSKKKWRLGQNMLINISQMKISVFVPQRFITIFWTKTGMYQSKTEERQIYLSVFVFKQNY